MILKTSLPLSVVLAVTIPFIIIGVVIIARKSHPMSKTQQKRLDKLNRISRENLTGIRVIRAFGNDDYERKDLQIQMKNMQIYLKSYISLWQFHSLVSFFY